MPCESGLSCKTVSRQFEPVHARLPDVSQGTEELAASARQTASSAGELERIAAEMERLASRFRVA